MVVHWKRQRGAGARRSMIINGLGALATAATVIVVLTAKFAEGAWITLLLIPSLLAAMIAVHRHYQSLVREIALDTPLDLSHLEPPVVVIPVQTWSKIAQKALRFAIHLSVEVHVVQVRVGEKSVDLRDVWPRLVEAPALELGLPVPKLTVIDSPYRFVFGPILDFVGSLEKKYPRRYIAVVIPELVEIHWYHYFLHNQRAAILKALLLVKGDQRISVINVPWYLAV
jgi:hypothetical protein